MINKFFAYPAHPNEIGHTIEAAIKESSFSSQNIESWKALEIIGNFIKDTILDTIKDSIFIADITRLNCNVVYEIGYAIGDGRDILLTKNISLSESSPTILDVGIFDTLGFIEYQNSTELADILKNAKANKLYNKTIKLNYSSPVYLLETKYKTDFSTRIAARIKKARLAYRSFDPNESPRLSANDAIEQVFQSHGIIISLLGKEQKEYAVHNIRASFIAGLSEGMKKQLLILQYGNGTIPIDIRDFSIFCRTVDEVNQHIADFAPNIVESMQNAKTLNKKEVSSTIEKFDLGSSAAENEMKTLQYYYLKTDAYLKASRGEVQLVIGRKGSGKSAIFLQIRDKERSSWKNIVLDLKPEGYKLIKFKEQVLEFLQEGTFQHTIMAFWEYILLLEICHKVLENDKRKILTQNELFEPYKKLEELYRAEEYITEGDFSERMSNLMDNLKLNYNSKYGDRENVRLSTIEITGLLYKTDIKKLQTHLSEYLKHKENIWLLFDNVDKGWPSSGLKHEDLLIIRALVDASKKIQRFFEKNKINLFTIIFLRNDVYDLLVLESPDRQKESKVLLDWTDQDLLRQIIKLRIVSSFPDLHNEDFDTLWRKLCVSHFKGEESFQFIIDRCLMRPRFLINFINHCRSFAINLNHFKIHEEDIEKGLKSYSSDLLTDINLEIRDIFPEAEDILFAFITSNRELSFETLKTIIENKIKNQNYTDKIIDLLLWYGFLGVRHDDEIIYIYNINYSLQLLKGLINQKNDEVVFIINPGFSPALLLKI